MYIVDFDSDIEQSTSPNEDLTQPNFCGFQYFTIAVVKVGAKRDMNLKSGSITQSGSAILKLFGTSIAQSHSINWRSGCCQKEENEFAHFSFRPINKCPSSKNTISTASTVDCIVTKPYIKDLFCLRFNRMRIPCT